MIASQKSKGEMGGEFSSMLDIQYDDYVSVCETQ